MTDTNNIGIDCITLSEMQKFCIVRNFLNDDSAQKLHLLLWEYGGHNLKVIQFSRAVSKQIVINTQRNPHPH